MLRFQREPRWSPEAHVLLYCQGDHGHHMLSLQRERQWSPEAHVVLYYQGDKACGSQR